MVLWATPRVEPFIDTKARCENGREVAGTRHESKEKIGAVCLALLHPREHNVTTVAVASVITLNESVIFSRRAVASLLTSSLTIARVLALSERSTAAPFLYEAIMIPPVKMFSKLSVASSSSSDTLVDF